MPMSCPRSAIASGLQVAIEKGTDLAESLRRLRRKGRKKLGVALRLEDLQRCLDSRLPQLAMDPHGIAEQEIPRT